MSVTNEVRELVNLLRPEMTASELTAAKDRINTLLDRLQQVETQFVREHADRDARALVREMFEVDNAGD